MREPRLFRVRVGATILGMSRSGRSERTWAKWRGLVAEQERSGLSVQRFCIDRGLASSSLFAWRRKLCGGSADARRKFVEAEASRPEVAAQAVELIGQLYGVEEEARDLDASRRLTLRQRKSRPVLHALKDRLHTWRDQLLPRHPMAQAAQYALNQWETLTVFAQDGAVPIDNNASEREMKRIVLNRRNSLFVGGPRGGRTSAILASLTSTCRRHDIDPQRYLTQLLTNLPETKTSDLDHWLPDAWKARNTPPPT